ncbi:MAG: alanine racemase [Acidobacteria bacterium]|nr:alanine racemase [Acidobacteriota bacterium]
MSNDSIAERLTGQRPTWAEIHLGHLEHNYRAIRRRVGPGVQCMAVLKADAYGHGAVVLAPRLEQWGVEAFAVAIPEEGAALRAAGITRPILCLQGFWKGQEDLLLEQNLTPAVFDPDTLRLLDEAAAKWSVPVLYHLKIDTGMGRLGVPVDALAPFLAQAAKFRHVRMEGVLSHLASAGEGTGEAQTEVQVNRFESAVRMIREAGFQPRLRHMANSAGTHAYPEAWLNMVRPGAILYGLKGDILRKPDSDLDLKPVLSLRTRIMYLKSVPEGTPLGYGATFTTTRPSRIATLTIGYHDGYPRALSNRGSALVRGRRVPVVGRISMDLTLLDVSAIEDAEVGDVATLIGSDGEQAIRVEEVAAMAGTISYEIVCGIGLRVPRVPVEG